MNVFGLINESTESRKKELVKEFKHIKKEMDEADGLSLDGGLKEKVGDFQYNMLKYQKKSIDDYFNMIKAKLKELKLINDEE